MTGRCRAGFVLIACGALLSLSFAVGAQNVEHHGFQVDPDVNLGDCMACHDGVAAGSVDFCLVDCNFRSPHSAVNIYPPPGKKGYASIRDVVQKGIKLVDGRITCISCHDLRNKGQYHLVMTMDGSKLCFACHII